MGYEGTRTNGISGTPGTTDRSDESDKEAGNYKKEIEKDSEAASNTSANGSLFCVGTSRTV